MNRGKYLLEKLGYGYFIEVSEVSFKILRLELTKMILSIFLKLYMNKMFYHISSSSMRYVPIYIKLNCISPSDSTCVTNHAVEDTSVKIEASLHFFGQALDKLSLKYEIKLSVSNSISDILLMETLHIIQ